MKKYINSILNQKIDYEIFRSEISHIYKRFGTLNFIDEAIENQCVELLWNAKQYLEAFYILSAVDYLCSSNNISLYNGYKNYRNEKLNTLRFPREVMMMDMITKTDDMKNKAIKDCKDHPCGKFFYAHNIIERSFNDAI